MKYSTYILETADYAYYVGSTADIEKRLVRHSRGECRFTKTRLPVKLVYREEFEKRTQALKREKQLKSWKSRTALEGLIKSAGGPIV